MNPPKKAKWKTQPNAKVSNTEKEIPAEKDSPAGKAPESSKERKALDEEYLGQKLPVSPEVRQVLLRRLYQCLQDPNKGPE